jgi:hypothetical protein
MWRRRSDFFESQLDRQTRSYVPVSARRVQISVQRACHAIGSRSAMCTDILDAWIAHTYRRAAAVSVPNDVYAAGLTPRNASHGCGPSGHAVRPHSLRLRPAFGEPPRKPGVAGQEVREHCRRGKDVGDEDRRSIRLLRFGIKPVTPGGRPHLRSARWCEMSSGARGRLGLAPTEVCSRLGCASAPLNETLDKTQTGGCAAW